MAPTPIAMAAPIDFAASASINFSFHPVHVLIMVTGENI
jgi:hypothetical protein